MGTGHTVVGKLVAHGVLAYFSNLMVISVGTLSKDFGTNLVSAAGGTSA